MHRVSPVAGAAAVTALLGLMALGMGPQRHDGEAGSEPEGARVPPSPSASANPSSAAEALLHGEPMNLNHARREDLMLLPRIGPTLAERIEEDRRDHGPYTRLEELSRVSGVGDATVERLRPLACAGRDCPAGASQVEDPAEP